MYQLRLLQPAIHDIANLDKSTRARIVQRAKWLRENVESIIPKRLSGQFAGLCKLREGNYRIIYQVLREEKTIVVHHVGHRRDVYKKK
jgi:mRNA interferase RelE/StbE